MFDGLSLRVRILLFFVLLGIAVPLVIAAAMVFAAQRLGGDVTAPLVLSGGLASLALMALVGYVWQLFDTHVARPITGVSRDLQTLMHANTEHDVATDQARYLGLLAPTIDEIAKTLKDARASFDEKVALATAKTEEQRAQLEAILRDLDEGVIVCNRSHQVLLYNRRALRFLGDSGELGLARSLFSLLERQPFVNTMERLTNRLASGRYKSHKDHLSTPFSFSTRDGRIVLRGKMSLMTDNDALETVSGYVLTFSDQTLELEQRAQVDRLLRTVMDGFREPVSSLLASSETLHNTPNLQPQEMSELTAILKSDSEQLADTLADLSAGYDTMAGSHWPMCDTYSANMLSIVASRYRENPVLTVDVSGSPVWMHCDSNTVIELVDVLLRQLVEHCGATTFALTANDETRRPYVDIVWSGEAASAQQIETWAAAPLPRVVAGLTGSDVLVLHRSDIWCEAMDDERVRLRIPLLPAVDAHVDKAVGGAPIRLEFYDFDLLNTSDEAKALADRPLRELTFVVFDTETTGLEPSNGDEIISIAGVRVVNGRVLTGEIFDKFVNPKRKIPQRSTLVHGISEEMVKEAPGIETVLPRFHGYVGDAVIVAHNAAFDLKFLELKKDLTGLSFDNPVLDTVLLSAIVHDHTDQHTLDAVAERFNVEIPPETRHTALGDSLATAYVLVKIIDLLEVNGIHTLGDAQAASERIVQIRKQQAKY